MSSARAVTHCHCLPALARRLGVLERRAEDHRSMTAEKLAALEARLRADVRLLPAIKAGLV